MASKLGELPLGVKAALGEGEVNRVPRARRAAAVNLPLSNGRTASPATKEAAQDTSNSRSASVCDLLPLILEERKARHDFSMTRACVLVIWGVVCMNVRLCGFWVGGLEGKRMGG